MNKRTDDFADRQFFFNVIYYDFYVFASVSYCIYNNLFI